MTRELARTREALRSLSDTAGTANCRDARQWTG